MADAVELLHPHVRINCLNTLRLAAVVHVRHKSRKPCRLLHFEVSVGANVLRIRGDIEIRRAHLNRLDNMFWCVSSWIKHQSDSCTIGNLFADCMIMNIELYPLSGLYKLSCVLGVDIAVLTNGIFVQCPALCDAILVDQAIHRMVEYANASTR